MSRSSFAKHPTFTITNTKCWLNNIHIITHICCMNAQRWTISGRAAISGWNWLLHQSAGSSNYDISPSETTACFPFRDGLSDNNCSGRMRSRPNWSTEDAEAMRPSIFWNLLSGTIVPQRKDFMARWMFSLRAGDSRLDWEFLIKCLYHNFI
jgi:hypothetical protein